MAKQSFDSEEGGHGVALKERLPVSARRLVGQDERAAHMTGFPLLVYSPPWALKRGLGPKSPKHQPWTYTVSQFEVTPCDYASVSDAWTGIGSFELGRSAQVTSCPIIETTPLSHALRITLRRVMGE